MDEVVGTQLVPSVARALHSDPHDFAGLYIRHRSSFSSHARRYLRDQRDADEVVQEAFLRLFLALPELETELQALAYCRRTITNLCIDRFRAQARRPYLVDLDSIPVDTLADDDPGDPVVRAEDAALVRAALSMLSPLHRAALVKREIEEKPLPVIAVELDIPEDSVKHLLFRARRALRRILTESSLAPGGTGQLSEALAKAVSKGGLAVVAVLLAAIGLGTGPDLRMLPVVGQDLPSIGQIVTSIGAAITGQPPAAPDAQGGGGEAPPPPAVEGGDSGLLLPAASPSPSSTAPAAAPTLSGSPAPAASPSPATATAGIGPALPSPSVVPDPALSPSGAPASPGPSPSPTPSVTPGPSPSPSPDPTASKKPQNSIEQGHPGTFANYQAPDSAAQ
ncbi:MAG: RNA polymerase sigma factor [Pseudorhodobacter sp.]|nr:RNA polymerase sigma factor [Frankiaceae bacterium]